MTLNQKFDSVILSMDYKDSPIQRDLCERIADDFAQDFAEWSVTRALGCDVFTLKRNELEIYKKEKGL
jgi:hypothetical protein